MKKQLKFEKRKTIGGYALVAEDSKYKYTITEKYLVVKRKRGKINRSADYYDFSLADRKKIANLWHNDKIKFTRTGTQTLAWFK